MTFSRPLFHVYTNSPKSEALLVPRTSTWAHSPLLRQPVIPSPGGHHIVAELSVNTQESFSPELLDSNTSPVSVSPESVTMGIYQQYGAHGWTQGFQRLSLHWLHFRAFPGRPAGFRHQNKQIKKGVLESRTVWAGTVSLPRSMFCRSSWPHVGVLRFLV